MVIKPAIQGTSATIELEQRDLEAIEEIPSVQFLGEAEEVREGLSLVSRIAAGFKVGSYNQTTMDYDLLRNDRTVARISWEFVCDLSNTPELQEKLRDALVYIDEEVRNPNPRLVLISTTGWSYQE